MKKTRITWEEFSRIFGQRAVDTDGCIEINNAIFRVDEADSEGFSLCEVIDADVEPDLGSAPPEAGVQSEEFRPPAEEDA